MLFALARCMRKKVNLSMSSGVMFDVSEWLKLVRSELLLSSMERHSQTRRSGYACVGSAPNGGRSPRGSCREIATLYRE